MTFYSIPSTLGAHEPVLTILPIEQGAPLPEPLKVDACVALFLLLIQCAQVPQYVWGERIGSGPDAKKTRQFGIVILDTPLRSRLY